MELEVTDFGTAQDEDGARYRLRGGSTWVREPSSPSDQSATFTTTYGSCAFGCGQEEPDGPITIVTACPVHGALDLSKPVGCIKTLHDYTIEAQARLLRRILDAGSVDIVGTRLAIVSGLDLTPAEVALLRTLTNPPIGV